MTNASDDRGFDGIVALPDHVALWDPARATWIRAGELFAPGDDLGGECHLVPHGNRLLALTGQGCLAELAPHGGPP